MGMIEYHISNCKANDENSGSRPSPSLI